MNLSATCLASDLPEGLQVILNMLLLSASVNDGPKQHKGLLMFYVETTAFQIGAIFLSIQ